MMGPMTESQRTMFLNEMNLIRKDSGVGVLLALFLGSFGAHRFYLRQMGLGALYAVFCLTLIPGLVGVVECFLMSNRVKIYNQDQALIVARLIRGSSCNERSCKGCGQCEECMSLLADEMAFAE